MRYFAADLVGVNQNGRRLHATARAVRSATSQLLASYDAAAEVVATATAVDHSSLVQALRGYRDRYQKDYQELAEEVEAVAASTIEGGRALDDGQRESWNTQRVCLTAGERTYGLLDRPITVGGPSV